jgi:hypothetical protein
MVAFSALYSELRLMLGDVGKTALYGTAQLDMGLRHALWIKGGAWGDGSDGTAAVDPANFTDLVWLCAKAALGLVKPTSDPLSYRTPVLSVSRPYGRQMHVQELERLVRDAEQAGDGGVSSYTEWNKLAFAPYDVLAALASIQTALIYGPGEPVPGRL